MMGAYRIYGNNGRYVDIHDDELLRFVREADSLSPDAAYVAKALARLTDVEVHDG